MENLLIADKGYGPNIQINSDRATISPDRVEYNIATIRLANIYNNKPPGWLFRRSASNMKNIKCILPFIITGLLMTPLCYIAVTNFIVTSRQSIEPPDWVNIARLFNVAFSFICVFSVFIFEHKIKTNSAFKLTKKGQDPELVMFISGASLFLAPACLAFFLVLFGSVTVDVKVYSAFAFLAILYWSWRYRRLFLNLKDEHGIQTISELIETSDSKEIMSKIVRAYTIVLAILGTFSLLFLGMKILLIFQPPENYDMPTQMDIIWVPYYSLLFISCWTTVVLRIKKSSIAIFATRAISLFLLIWVPFGTAAFIYWIWKVRKREEAKAEPIGSVDQGHNGPVEKYTYKK